MSETDEIYMRQALFLAEQGRGWVNPNPLVGAVIVKEGKVIGQGCHKKYGELHAERNALADCRENPKGATMYVTLEPCCHEGKTPPCTIAVRDAGIERVVIGALDVNPKVRGKGAAWLKEQGIRVDTGILKEACREQNRIFFHYMETKKPYVVMKYAMTMDGKIASASGKSKWITGEEARENVHRTRHELMGILVGSGTVKKDNPMLDCRIKGLKSPMRIICDTRLKTPLHAAVVETAGKQPTLIATSSEDREKWGAYQKKGCEILFVPKKGEHLDMEVLMEMLGERGIDSILLEGGASVNWSALKAGLVNEVHTYIAPKIFGGAAAKSPVGGEGILSPSKAFYLERTETEVFGEDILIKSRIALRK